MLVKSNERDLGVNQRHSASGECLRCAREDFELVTLGIDLENIDAVDSLLTAEVVDRVDHDCFRSDRPEIIRPHDVLFRVFNAWE